MILQAGGGNPKKQILDDFPLLPWKKKANKKYYLAKEEWFYHVHSFMWRNAKTNLSCFLLPKHLGVSKNSGTPKWMVKIMENPIKMDDLGVPLFLETPIYVKEFLMFFSEHVRWFDPCDRHPLKLARSLWDRHILWNMRHQRYGPWKVVGSCGPRFSWKIAAFCCREWVEGLKLKCSWWKRTCSWIHEIWVLIHVNRALFGGGQKLSTVESKGGLPFYLEQFFHPSVECYWMIHLKNFICFFRDH